MTRIRCFALIAASPSLILSPRKRSPRRRRGHGRPLSSLSEIQRLRLSLNTNFVRIPAEIAGIAGDKVQWGDGIFLIIIAAAAVVAWKLKNKVAMLCVGSGAAVFSIIAISQAQQAKNLIAGTVAENVVQMGIGYYLCILASIALLASAVLYFKSTKEHQ